MDQEISKKRIQNNILQIDEKDDLTLKETTLLFRQFVDQRNWHHFHTPRNLILALTGQVGQLAQIFQWKGQVKPGLQGFSQRQKIHVGEEICDVLSYLLRLSDVCGIDICEAVKDKIKKNRKKYPQNQFKGEKDEFARHMDKKLQNKQKKLQSQNKQV